MPDHQNPRTGGFRGGPGGGSGRVIENDKFTFTNEVNFPEGVGDGRMQVEKIELPAINGNIQGTGFVMPALSVFWTWLVHVRSGEVTGTPELNIGSEGVGNDNLGATVDVSTTGLVKPTVQTPIGNIGDDLIVLDSNSIEHQEPSVVQGGRQIQVQGESAFSEFEGDLYIFYTDLSQV